MNQANGETLDIPHPVDVKNVKSTPQTDWHNSPLKADRDRDEDGDWRYDVVKGRITINQQFDDYGEPLGEPRLILEHKYGHPTRQSKDVSTTAIKPHEIRKLKERFPGAFAEFETKLLRSRQEMPLVLLDSVPPEVVQVIFTLGARTVRDFAEFSDEKMAALQEKLVQHKMSARVNFLGEYLARAREMVGETPAPKRGKAA
jgi:hypothetical protein